MFLLTTIIAKVFAQPQPPPQQRYIIVYPTHLRPFPTQRNDTYAAEVLMRTDKLIFVAANLNDNEVSYLRSIIYQYDGLVESNNPVLMDDITSVHKSLEMAEVNQPLSHDVRCSTPLNNVDFIVIDNLINKNNPELDTVNITQGPVFPPDPQPCHPHATQSTSIILGKRNGIIPQGDRGVYNIVPFDCKNFALPANIIKSFSAAVQFANLNARNGRRSIVTYPGIGNVNIALNLAAKEVVSAGIPFFVGAGNSGVNIRRLHNIAAAEGVFAVGATDSPGNIPAPYSNYGEEYIKLFLPGSISIADENNPNSTVALVGTDVSARFAAALGGLELGLDLSATPAEVYDRITARTRVAIVQPPVGSHFATPMKVLLDANACPADTRLYTDIFLTGNGPKRFSTWYNGTMQSRFCVRFSAISRRGPILLKLRKDKIDPDHIVIKIGDSMHIRGRYAHTMRQSNKRIVAKDTHKYLLKHKAQITFSIRSNGSNILVEYEQSNSLNASLLMFSELKKQPQEIAFGSINNRVRYIDGFKCAI